ncbi:MAG: hypothetical protein AB2754_16170 [Candidatus Thiodiazotropha endolucinida]
MTEKTPEKTPEKTMLYSLKKLEGGELITVDRKKIECYSIVTFDPEGMKKKGWCDLQELIKKHEAEK